jgi:hypothetical protein
LERLKGWVIEAIAQRLPKEVGSYAEYQALLESVEPVLNRVAPLIRTIKNGLAELAAGKDEALALEESRPTLLLALKNLLMRKSGSWKSVTLKLAALATLPLKRL